MHAKRIVSGFAKSTAFVALAVGLSGISSLAQAQSAWPNKPVTFVVGYPPGGQTDFAGRVVVANMQKELGQPIVIDNRGGGGGNIGSDIVMQSAPDGYKLLVGNGVITINPHTYRSTPMVDPLKFTPIGTLLTSGLVLVVPATSPVKDYKEFVQYIKEKAKKPEGVNYGSSGAGSLTHVTMELLRERMGKPEMNHVPYKGTAAVAVDLIAGRVDALFDATSVISPFIKSGQMKPLLVTSAQRVPAMPDVPTAAEVGVKDFEIISFIGLYGPPNLPAEIVKKANTAMNAALKDEAVRKNILDRGDEPGGGSAEDLGKLTQSHFKLWGGIVKANDIRVD